MYHYLPLKRVAGSVYKNAGNRADIYLCGDSFLNIKKNGSAPRGVGTQMLVSSDNRIIGTIGGGCAEAEVISHCRRLFRKQVFKCGLMDVSMNTDDAEKEGMVCGGSISVLLEQIG